LEVRRAILTWAHFKVKERLEAGTDQLGKIVVEVDEA
jgi:hypothetical protein